MYSLCKSDFGDWLPFLQVKDKDFSHIDYVPAALTDYAAARSK